MNPLLPPVHVHPPGQIPISETLTAPDGPGGTAPLCQAAAEEELAPPPAVAPFLQDRSGYLSAGCRFLPAGRVACLRGLRVRSPASNRRVT